MPANPDHDPIKLRVQQGFTPTEVNHGRAQFCQLIHSLKHDVGGDGRASECHTHCSNHNRDYSVLSERDVPGLGAGPSEVPGQRDVPLSASFQILRYWCAGPFGDSNRSFFLTLVDSSPAKAPCRRNKDMPLTQCRGSCLRLECLVLICNCEGLTTNRVSHLQESWDGRIRISHFAYKYL